MLDSVFPVVSNSKVRWNGSDSAKKTPRYPWVFVGARAEEHRLVGCEQSLTLSLTATSKLASVVMRQASMTTFAPLAQAATRDHPCASLSQPTNARVCPNQQYRDRRRVYQRRFSPKEGRRTINSAIAAPQPRGLPTGYGRLHRVSPGCGQPGSSPRRGFAPAPPRSRDWSSPLPPAEECVGRSA